MNDAGDYTPDAEIGINGNLNRLVFRICRNQLTRVVVLHKPFHCQLAVDDSDDNFAACRFDGSVDNQDIVVVDAGIFHRISRYTDEEGCRRVWNEEFVKVELSIYMIVGRGWETC